MTTWLQSIRSGGHPQGTLVPGCDRERIVTVAVMRGDLIRPTAEAIATRVLDSSPDGLIVVETGGRISYANESMHDMAGAVASLVGRYVDELVPDAVRAQHRQLRQTFEADPKQRSMGSGLELMLRRLDGDEVPVEISLSPFSDETGSYVIAAVRDMTERRQNDRRLAIANEQLALVLERERIGRDLHDVILQKLYGTGLTTQAIAAACDDVIAGRLDAVVGEIDRIIAEVRTIVFTLGGSGQRGAMGQDLADIVAQSSRVLGFTPALRIEGPVDSVMSNEAATEMFASMREALGNVARHASATTVDVVIVVEGQSVVMTVTDNGVGPPEMSGQPRHGNGLLNLRARAAMLGGTCTLAPGADRGSVLSWSVRYSD